MKLVQTPMPQLQVGEPGHAAQPGRPARGRGLVNGVMLSLATSIREGVIKPGEKLPSESVIMTQFGVSRTVVREAISRLQANRLVDTRHGVGTFALAPGTGATFRIADVDLALVSDIVALLELRVSLETEAAGLAAHRRTEQNLRAMQGMLDAYQVAVLGDTDSVPSDFNFHVEVARATGNRHFAELLSYLGTMIIPRARVNTPSSAPEGRLNYLQRVHAEHENIFTAIANQDPEAARAAMRTHLSNSKNRIKDSQRFSSMWYDD